MDWSLDRSGQERADHARDIAKQRVVVVDEPAEPATVAEMLIGAGTPAKPDLVVLDIDGNDWWVLYALLQTTSPRVLVVEYNGTYRPGQWWVEPYRKGLAWDQSFRHGASLGAMVRLASVFGLVLVGCDSTGVNSFYVDAEVLRVRGIGSAGRLDNLYRGPWFAPGLWGHPRQRFAGVNHAPLRPLSDDELSQIGLQAERWPTTAKRLRVGQPVVVQATLENGTDQLLTSQGHTPLHLAWRWRRNGEPAMPWRDEPRVRVWPVDPRRTGRTRLWSRAPTFAGSYQFELSLVQENVCWIEGQCARISFEVDQ